MLTGEIRNQIDRIWDAFWSGGISNPLEVIEQITYLLFLRRLDDLHTLEENKSTTLKQPMERRIFPEGNDPKGRPYQDLRWSRFKHFSPAEMFTVVDEHVFPFLRTLGGNGSTYANHMKDACFTIPTPALLAKVVDLLDQMPGDPGGDERDEGDAEVISRNSIGGAYSLTRLGEAVEFLDSKRRPVTESDRRAGPYPYFGANGQQGTIDVTPFVTGTTRGKLTKAGASEIVIPFPPPAKQRRIAEILDRAEALRTKRRAALAQLDILIKTIFFDLFGDPGTNPKRWPISRIGDLLESASYGTSEKAGTTGEFPAFRMNNITRTGEMNLTDLKFMQLPANKRDRYLVRAGDVLLNRTNSVELVGKSAIYRDKRQMAYAGYLVRLRTDDKNDPEYLSAFLNTSYAKKMLRGMCKSIIGMANINATEIQAMKIAHPPPPLQREFARRVAAVDKLKTAHRASLAEMDTLFAALQHRAFRGTL